MKRIILLLLLVGAVGFFYTLKPDKGDKSTTKDIDTRPLVVCTTGMIGDIAKSVGGDKIKVVNLMGPGVDPHLYRATEGDVRTLSKARLIFYNGLHLEAKLGEILNKIKTKPVVAVAERIPDTKLIKSDTYENQYDPHVWFNPQLWIYAVKAVRDTLIKEDPDNAVFYQTNATLTIDGYDKLYEESKQTLSQVAPSRRILVTAHDAFTYFGDAFGFKVVGLQGISTESKAGTKDIANLAAFIVEHKIPAIFVETSIPKRTLEAVQAAVKSRGWDVMIGGELFSDAMGDPSTKEGTYIGMVKHNVTTISSALK